MTELDLDIDLNFDDEIYDKLDSTGDLIISFGDGVEYDVDANGEDEIIIQFWKGKGPDGNYPIQTAHDCPDCNEELYARVEERGRIGFVCPGCGEVFIGDRADGDIIVQGRR